MIVGVPTEIKRDEYRVAITPAGVRELSARGHEVLIQAGAGVGSAMGDEQFAAQGARIVPDAQAVFADAELVLKVKEPQPVEVEMLRAGQTLFTYLHLAAESELARGLQESGATCIAYETVEDSAGRLPLLAPMSEVAGKIATQAGAFMLEKPLGGRGILLGGVPGVAAATVLVIGGGVVGMNAAFIAIGMQADVFVFDRSIDRLRELDIAFGGRASTVYSSTLAIEEMLPLADLVIGAVLVHGGRAPHVISRAQLQLMRRHAVLVDVSIDQGGCFETSRPTTHSEPTFEVDGITHYCVTNMPGAVPITSTYALTNATLPYVLALADRGVRDAMVADPGLRMGLNVRDGEITHPAVIEALAGAGAGAGVGAGVEVEAGAGGEAGAEVEAGAGVGAGAGAGAGAGVEAGAGVGAGAGAGAGAGVEAGAGAGVEAGAGAGAGVEAGAGAGAGVEAEVEAGSARRDARGARSAPGAGVGTVGALADADGGFGGDREAEIE